MEIIIATVGVIGSLLVAVVPKIIEMKSGYKKDIKEIKHTVSKLVRDQEEQGDMIYQLLDHAATNNNTGNMKRCLDAYNAHYRKNKEE